MNIGEIRAIDDELVVDILDESIVKLTHSFATCPFPRTMESLLMIMMNTNFLKTAIFSLCESDDSFSAAILYRSMIEHYLRHTYLFVRFAEEKNDAPGVEFYELADIKEHFDYFRSQSDSASIFGKAEPSLNVEEYVFSKYPKYRQIAKTDLKRKLDQFGVKQLVRFIWTRLGTVGLEPALYDQFLTDYSILSSYVHGGPHVNRLVLFYSGKAEKREMENLRLCRQAFFISSLIKMDTFIVAGQYDRYFLRHLDTIREYSLLGMKTNRDESGTQD